MFFIRSSLWSTRKLFRRTVQSVKSLFSERTTYQRLPKLPAFKSFSCQSYRELDRFYSEFTNRWDNVVGSSTSPIDGMLHHESEEIRDDHNNNDEEKKKTNRLISYREMSEKDVIERRCLVAEKLRDLEMIDSNNLDNAQDIDEVLQLYSLLTCPVYIDMFDKFVVDMYSDIFNSKASSRY